MSDPHFGVELPGVVEALVALAHQCHPTLIVVSGDLTQRARRDQFRRARDFFARLPAGPRLLVPGNHDIPLFNLAARWLTPYRGYRHLAGSLEPEFESAELLVIGVNTARAGRHSRGEVSGPQIHRVAARLRHATPRQLRVVVAHHPLDVPDAADERHLLIGHDEAVPTWADAGADLLLGGHIHLPFVSPLRERWPGITRDAWVVQAGTAVSRRLRPRTSNSVHLIEYDAAGAACTVVQWDYDEAAGRFRAGTGTRIRADRGTIARGGGSLA